MSVRMEDGGRYIDYPSDLCSNPGHPQGRFHPLVQSPSLRHPVELFRWMRRRLQFGCGCPVVPKGEAVWVVRANRNWAEPPERIRMTQPTDRREARANWVLLANMRGFHDVRVERMDEA
jgi:hypothetical protein